MFAKKRYYFFLAAIVVVTIAAIVIFVGSDLLPGPVKGEIIIYKEERELELYVGADCVGIYYIALSSSPYGTKDKEGDRKVPEGDYYICTHNGQSNFTYFLGLSYPSIIDAQRGFDSGAIDKKTLSKIAKAIEKKECPPWDTALGGEIGIHGGGIGSDWTLGCIAVTDEAILQIKEYAPLGTPVRIYASRK